MPALRALPANLSYHCYMFAVRTFQSDGGAACGCNHTLMIWNGLGAEAGNAG